MQVSLMLITSTRKLPAEVVVLSNCSFHVECLSVGQSRLSVAVWKAPKIEEFAAPKLGPPNGPNFGVAVSPPQSSSKLYCGSWVHFAAPFLGPRDGPLFWPLNLSLWAQATRSRLPFF